MDEQQSAFRPGQQALHCALQLPDGNEIEIGPDRFAVPELLFNPVLLPSRRFCVIGWSTFACTSSCFPASRATSPSESLNCRRFWPISA